MLTTNQQRELREQLENAQNPIFYYDNDADGLCSFLLLRRWLGRGQGVPIRSYPELDASYAKKAAEMQADAAFILDKPVLSPAFVNALAALSLPIVWIDHHDVVGEDFSNVPNFFTYNPTKNAEKLKSSEPVTFHMYQLTKRKEDIWIAVMGCVADHYLPSFATEFAQRFPELWGKEIAKPFDAYYRTEIGTLARALNFGLKDSASNVEKLQMYLLSCRSPHDVLAESSDNEAFRSVCTSLRERYEQLLASAEQMIRGNLLFFVYGGTVSMSSDLSNELSYRHPASYVVVVYQKGAIVNISMRGKGVKTILARLLTQFSDARGGGHEDAVGARLKTSDLEKFRMLLEQEIKA